MLSRVALALVFVVVACQKQASPPAPAASTSTVTTAAKTYTMNGKLVSRDPAKNEVTIDNEEVPGGVMAPMTMAYELRGAKVDSLPKDGAKITSTLHEQDGKYWVTDVKPRK